mgnify:FL=1
MKRNLMTKTSLLALAMAAAISLAACGASSQSTTATPAPTATPETSTAEDGAMTEDMGVAEVAEPDSELSAMVDSIYEAYPVELMMMQTTAIDLNDEVWLTYNTGLSAEEAALVDAGVKSESMTGSQAYTLVLLRVKDAADAQTVADTMLDKMDPARWVCVMADKMRVATFDDKVLFVMTDSELTDIDALFAAVPDALGVEFTYDKSADVAADDAMVPSQEEMNNPVAG